LRPVFAERVDQLDRHVQLPGTEFFKGRSSDRPLPQRAGKIRTDQWSLAQLAINGADRQRHHTANLVFRSAETLRIACDISRRGKREVSFDPSSRTVAWRIEPEMSL
jgi:hypothetical protein